MRKCIFTIWLFFLAASTMSAQQQTAPRKYIIKPLNLETNTEIRARSTRNIQVQVTDENDRPIPDAPLLLLLSGIGAGNNAAGTLAAQTVGNVTGAAAGQAASSVTGAAGQIVNSGVGNLAGQSSVRALTDQYGIARATLTTNDSVGSSLRLQLRVEGTDVTWEGTLDVVHIESVVETVQNVAQMKNDGPLPSMEAEDQACIALINQFRQEYQLPTLRVSVKLTKAAQWLSKDNAENKPDDPDHTDSLGRDVGKRLLDFGYQAIDIKENIVVGATTAAQAMKVWLDSGFHIRNMLNARVKMIGVSRVCKKDAKFGCHWTVMMGSSEDQVIP